MRPHTTLRDLAEASDYDPNSMPVDKARAHIRRFLSPVTVSERLAIRAALGRVLAQDVISPIDVPQHDNSAMDGFAVRFEDLRIDGETALRVIGESFAGRPFSGKVGAEEAVRIMTGAVLPAGTDTVIQQERAKFSGTTVSVLPAAKHGINTRRAGEDLQRGAIALRTGQPLRAAEIGMLASIGVGEVAVYRRLRVAFFSTGDELVSIGQLPGPGQIYDSNRYTLYGLLTRLGFEVMDMGVIRDDPAAVEQAFRAAAGAADVVITSGGVSVGEADHVKSILDRLGQVLFWKIAMKPGRPLAYGKIGDAHFFGLPGNPVAVMVTFYQFVRDALLYLQGQTLVAPVPSFPVKCESALKKAPGRTEFQRGVLRQDAGGTWTVSATGDQGSGILSSMSQANCFIVLPADQGNVEPGALVNVQLLDGLV
ncbi:MAG: gephyrin-like molybdotransferase Glp [Burkholderiales bacterium]